MNVSASILRFISSLLTLFTKGFFVLAFSTDIEIGSMGNLNRNLQICLVFFKTKKRTNKDRPSLFKPSLQASFFCRTTTTATVSYDVSLLFYPLFSVGMSGRSCAVQGCSLFLVWGRLNSGKVLSFLLGKTALCIKFVNKH